MSVCEGVVAITGATRGIGRAVVEAVLERGGRVVAIATNEALLGELRSRAPEAVGTVVADLQDTNNLPRVGRASCDAFGRLDGLVNCAGIAEYQAFGAISAVSLEAQLRVNLMAPLLLSQHLANALRDSRGAIVNVSSTLSERVAPMTASYSATKAALNSITKTLALELAEHGVRVNAVLPGVVDTDMVRVPRLEQGEAAPTGSALEERIEHQLQRLRALHPLGRLGTPNDVATVITGLLDHPWQTGSLVTVDGGLSLA